MLSLVGVGGEAEGLEGGVMVSYVVHLEGGMGDAVFVGEEVFEFAPAGVAVFPAADEDVGGEGGESRGYGPDVEVVDLGYALGRGHLPAYFGGVEVGGGCFQEDVGRVTEELPGAAQDQESYGDAYEGVRVAPAGEDYDGGGYYRADRAKGVGEHVAHGALDVQALAAGPIEDDGASHVDEKPERGHEQHRASQDLRRLSQAGVGPGEKPKRDPPEPP